MFVDVISMRAKGKCRLGLKDFVLISRIFFPSLLLVRGVNGTRAP